MIDLSREKLLSRREAAALLHVSRRTLDRYRRTGTLGVRLEFARVGGRWRTSVEACQRFTDALTALENGEPVRLTSEARRRREYQQAVAVCEAHGV